jgi:hypothetical protein
MNNTALHPKQQAAEYDFIIVGSGAGGGPLACNLAKNGFRVWSWKQADGIRQRWHKFPPFTRTPASILI